MGVHIPDALDPSLIVDESNRERHVCVPHPEREFLRFIITEQHTTVRIKVLAMHQANPLLLMCRRNLDVDWKPAHSKSSCLGILRKDLSHHFTYQFNHRLLIMDEDYFADHISSRTSSIRRDVATGEEKKGDVLHDIIISQAHHPCMNLTSELRFPCSNRRRLRE